MTDEAQAARREYMRKYMAEYRKRNPEKQKAWAQAYWERKAKQQAEVQPANP